MRLISWNVNGLRACLNKGFLESIRAIDADVICLQETKVQAGQVALDLPGYHQYWNYADKKGYSGTAVFTRAEPLSVVNDFGADVHRHEGRVITVSIRIFTWCAATRPTRRTSCGGWTTGCSGRTICAAISARSIWSSRWSTAAI